ncbi:conserved hypothetical protein [Nocardia seriolae]|nr:conserved hypothetical protein [Nocardia seriolae]
MRYRMSNSSAFWLLAVALGLLLFASAAPSPMYPVYQQMWHYSSLVSTGVYAANAIALLVTLLFDGSLSDHIGPQPAHRTGRAPVPRALPGLGRAHAARGVGAPVTYAPGRGARGLLRWTRDFHPAGLASAALAAR